MIAKLEIYPYFIPQRWDVDFLPSHMKLLDETVRVVKKREFYEKVILNGEKVDFDNYSNRTKDELRKVYDIESIFLSIG